MKIYIAGSFSKRRERKSLKHMIEMVQSLYPNAELYIPMNFKVPGDYLKEDGTWNLPNAIWADRVYRNDMKNLSEADLVFVMYTGHISSSGTVWEMGYARGAGKHVIVYIPVWVKGDVSLMVMNSSNQVLKEDGQIHWVTSSFCSQFNQK